MLLIVISPPYPFMVTGYELSAMKKTQSIMDLDLAELTRQISDCGKCPRLRKHCQKIAKEKRRAYQDESYWGLPVPGFGDPKARLLIVGLAPAAHGANRTGRMFTGDQSGLWLYRAIFRAGFSNRETSIEKNDGLKLHKAYITAIARCAPPMNKPSPAEIKNCSDFLKAELSLLSEVKVYLVLGKVALDGLWPHLKERFHLEGSRPPFKHGSQMRLDASHSLVMSYHPSQQNTFTKRLTEPMFDQVFKLCQKLI